MGNQDAASILESMYATTADAPRGRTGKEAFEAMKLIQAHPDTDPSEHSAAETWPVRGLTAVPQYGQGAFGRSLQQLARLIKADAGVEAAFAEIGGWDHHGNENPQFSNLLRQFSSAMAAFSQDMGDRMEDIVLVTMSEFGRTVEENGNAGTDHGHGSLMMVHRRSGAGRQGLWQVAWP